MKNLFPLSHEEARNLLGQEVKKPNSVQKTYRFARDLAWTFGGRATSTNGSQFNRRVDEYTFPNGKVLRREISKVVDQGYGVTESIWLLES